MFNTFINGFLNGILSIVQTVLNIILSPIDNLLTNLFPTFTSYLSIFNNFISTFINGGALAYFFSLLPPLTRGAILMWYTFLITYYTIAWSYTLIIRVFNAIKKLKFW